MFDRVVAAVTLCLSLGSLTMIAVKHMLISGLCSHARQLQVLVEARAQRRCSLVIKRAATRIARVGICSGAPRLQRQGR